MTKEQAPLSELLQQQTLCLQLQAEPKRVGRDTRVTVTVQGGGDNMLVQLWDVDESLLWMGTGAPEAIVQGYSEWLNAGL